MSLIVALDTVYVIFVHFTIYNTRHNPPNIIKYIDENIVVRLFDYSIMGIENANEKEFRGFGNLVIWLWNVLE